MSGFDTALTATHLTRSNVWSSQQKEILRDELQGTGYVNWLNEFPDGDTFNIPSIGDATVDDYVENTGVTYNALDTGNFTFTVDKYKSSGTYITNKAKQDMFYMNQLVSSFVPKHARAIMEQVETDIFALQSQQTASAVNSINGAEHRFVATDSTTVSGKQVMNVSDFAKAKFALNKANVPLNNLIAVVDPTVAYHMETKSNLVNVSNNPQWEGIVESGITTGMRFIKNIYGFDVFESNYLASPGVETIDSDAVEVGSVANMFFSADSTILPFVGAWRQMPEVDSEYNKDLQREEYVTTARYGVKLYRPENLVVILSDTVGVIE